MAVIARDASVRTAMFTGVPTTFRPFGFGAAWEKFAEFAPSSGDPASAPFDAAAAWIAEVARSPGEPRALVVIHARGGHPPWDVRELANVPPKDYAGLIEPRRAAQIFAKLRRRRAREALSDSDRTRVRALEQLALGDQDHALGGLVAAIKTANLWDQSLFIVTGDVASGVSDQWFYGDGLDLKEAILTLPLYVHFPAGLYAGRRVADATEIYDVTRTALGALGLSFGRGARGRDLAHVASELEAGGGEVQVATLGDKYSARWGDLVLTGRFPRAPDLCDLALDAACAFNRRDVMPLATLAIFRRLVLGDAAGRGPVEKREPATLDGDIIAQLSVWGQD
jgi:Sulfatase